MDMKLKVLIMILITLLISSCSNQNLEVSSNLEEVSVYETSQEDDSEVATQKRKIDGGEIKIAIMPPKTLNPLKNEDIYVDRMLNLIFQDLYLLDDNRKPQPNLIELAVPNYVDNTLTLTLKNNLYWHDGESITSDDFIYSLNVLSGASENAVYKGMVENIVSYSAIDNLTVVIRYREPKYLKGYDLLFPIIPKHYYEKANNTNDVDLVPVGNAYYKFDKQVDSKNYTLVRDETKEDKAFIDTIKIIVLMERETELYSFERGNIDIVVSDLQEWGKYQIVKNPNIYEYTNQVFEFIGFNLDRILISDKYFRELIAHSIDKDEISNRLYLGKGKTTNTFVNPDSWLYEKDTREYRYSFNEIQKLIEDYYVYDDELNILYKDINGLKKEVLFTIIVNEDNSIRASTAEYIKNNLINYGIKVDIQVLPYEEYINRFEVGNYDLVIGGYRFGTDQDVTQFLTNNIFNYNSNMLISRLIAFNEVVDEESYKIALGELQKLISNDLPFISLLYSENTVLTDENLIIPSLPSYSNLFSNVNEWYWVK